MAPCNVVTIAIALLAVFAAARAAGCADVTKDNADVPAGAVAVAKWPSAGVRIWECAGGQLVNASQITGKANFTAAAAPWTGGFYYIGQVARFNAKNGSNPEFSFDLDNAPGLKPIPGQIADARWTVNFLDANVPTAFKGDAVYLTRTNSTGGATPANCTTAKAATVEVPYTTDYTLYVCGAAVPSGAVSATFGALAAAVVALAALF